MKDLQELLSKKMSRKDFLKLFTFALLTMFGVNNFISSLSKKVKQQSKQADAQKVASNGFGSRKFGA